MRAPSAWKRRGSARNSLISCSSSTASSTPATSLKPTFGRSGASRLALCLPKLIIWPRPPAPPRIRRITKIQIAAIRRIGSSELEDRGQGRAMARRLRGEGDLLALEQRLQTERRLIARIVRLQHVAARQRRRHEQRSGIEDDAADRIGLRLHAGDQLREIDRSSSCAPAHPAATPRTGRRTRPGGATARRGEAPVVRVGASRDAPGCPDLRRDYASRARSPANVSTIGPPQHEVSLPDRRGRADRLP